jgi:hypothetical protein
MRGYNTSAPGAVGYVDWVVNDVPDSTATYVPSPYNPLNIINITVNRIVTSKVDNFLKPFESLAAIGNPGADGNFFHLNSYDWLHATPPGPPIPVPSYLVGLSVVRGSVTGATPRDYATLFWAENALKWLFAYNTNGDGITIGAALPVGMGSLTVDGYIEVGTNPAQSGIIRIPNSQYIKARNATNTGDISLIEADNLDRVVVGSATDRVYIPMDLRVDGYIRDGGTPSLSGFIRNSNATSIITFRNLLNTTDIVALSSTSGNLVVLGDAINSGIRYNTSTGSEHILQVNTVNLLRVGNIGGTTYVNFENTAPFPTLSQFNATSGNGQNLRFQAQTSTAGSSTGGSAIISSGGGTSADGYVDIRANNVPKVRVFGTTVPVTADLPNNSVSNPNSVQIIVPTVRFYNTIVAPVILQDQTTSGVDAEPLLVYAQTATAVGFKGGDLKLSSGTSNIHAKDGYVRLQTGQIDRLFVDATANRITETLSIFSFNGLDGTFDASAVINPIINQRDDITPSITGQLMTIQAQNTPSSGTIGGSLNITSGDGTLADGYLRLQTGAITRLFLDATASQATWTLNTISFNGLDGYSDQVNVVNPVIRQRTDITASVTANRLTIQSQSAPNNGIAGNLVLNPGIGGATAPSSVLGPAYTRHGHLFFEIGSNTTSNVGDFFIDGYGPYFSIGGTTSAPAAIDGYVRVPNNVWALSAARNPASPPTASIHLIGTNSANQILIGEQHDTTYIPGTLFVGTFNSSTVLEIEDRLIHTNFNVPQIGVPVNPPTMITGLTIHRGNDATPTYNDEAGLIWTEGGFPSVVAPHINGDDGYWRFATVLNGNDTNLALSLNVMARALSVTDHPNSIIGNNPVPVPGALPSIGGLRTLNASWAVTSRNAASTQNMTLLGTDGYDHILLGDNVNTGFIFNTTGVYDFQVNSNANGFQIGDGYIRFGNQPALSGLVRTTQPANNTTKIITARNLANTTDHTLLGMDGYDRIVHGIDGYNVGHIFNAAAGSVYNFQIAGLTDKIMIGDGYIRSGATPAMSGIFRVSQLPSVLNPVISSRNFSNTLDMTLLGTDGYDHIVHGASGVNIGHIFNTSVGSVYDFQIAGVSNKVMVGDGYIRFGALPSLIGNLRHSQTSQIATDIVTARNVSNTNDLKVLGVDGYDRITHGMSGLNLGQIFNTAIGSVYDFQVNSTSNKIMIGDGYIRSGAIPAQSGIFRNSQTPQIATDIITARNVADGYDLKVLGVDGYDRIIYGASALNKGHIFNTAVDGYYDFQVNSISQAFVDGYKFAFKQGLRRHITPVSGTYNVLVTDHYMAVNASSVYTITLPTAPTLGDTYEFKDINGLAGTNNVTISGNGNNIDGAATVVLNSNYTSLIVTYTGAQWSVS